MLARCWKPILMSLGGFVLAAGIWTVGRHSARAAPVQLVGASAARQLAVHRCGAVCADGHLCRRLVRGAGFCPQHRGRN